MSVCTGGISQLSVNWDEKLRWLGCGPLWTHHAMGKAYIIIGSSEITSSFRKCNTLLDLWKIIKVYFCHC